MSLCACVRACLQCVCVNEKSKWRGQRGGVEGVEGGMVVEVWGGVEGVQWASDFPDEIHNVRRCILKRRFLMSPPHEYKFPTAAATRTEREGQTHLAFTRSEEVHPFSFFSRRLPSNHRTHQRWLHGSRYDSSIHTFVSRLHLFCSYLESLAHAFIMTGHIGERLGRNAQCRQRNSAGEFGGPVPEKPVCICLATLRAIVDVLALLAFR